jgi:hypothetical protein
MQQAAKRSTPNGLAFADRELSIAPLQIEAISRGFEIFCSAAKPRVSSRR